MNILVEIVDIISCSFQSIKETIYGKLRKDIGVILRELGEMKDEERMEAHACFEHIHILIKIPLKLVVSAFVNYLKGKRSLIIHKRQANLKDNQGSRTFSANGYYIG